MKLNRKKLILIFVIIICIILIFALKTNKNNVVCELKKDNLNTKISIILNQSISFNYNYLFESMDSTVDKYDSTNSYLKKIQKFDGVETNIEQFKKTINYFINIDLNKAKEEDYKILNIVDIMKLKSNKEIVKYYQKQGFTCEVI